MTKKNVKRKASKNRNSLSESCDKNITNKVPNKTKSPLVHSYTQNKKGRTMFTDDSNSIDNESKTKKIRKSERKFNSSSSSSTEEDDRYRKIKRRDFSESDSVENIKTKYRINKKREEKSDSPSKPRPALLKLHSDEELDSNYKTKRKLRSQQRDISTPTNFEKHKLRDRKYSSLEKKLK